MTATSESSTVSEKRKYEIVNDTKGKVQTSSHVTQLGAGQSAATLLLSDYLYCAGQHPSPIGIAENTIERLYAAFHKIRNFCFAHRRGLRGIVRPPIIIKFVVYAVKLPGDIIENTRTR